ncbi:hypothetical protein U0070_002231 [Myodes glareolus]|uniref:G-protein coupled receptors family 1 profile domain-containing protein n=1 Tax=Myodes glareolus TaxID=447135 RepID=A0AAW0IAD9_MYOGA
MPLFLLFTGIYVVTVAGNLGMITLIVLTSHLHNPMYYFLSSLSFIDFCQSTIVTPKMLVSFLTEKNLISFPGCITQLYFFSIFGVAECHTLGVMAYDRYVAICSPLLYNVTMSYQITNSLILGVYIFSVLSASVLTGFMIRIWFCKLDMINHYFCDFLPLLKLSCSNTYINELLILIFGTFNIFVPILTIITSYISIIASILRIKSTEGRSKAFSTCSSHISAVAVYFGSAAFMYLQPSSVNSLDQGKVSSVFYTTVVPMLNPLIYSLRNKDVSVALKKILQKKFIFQKIHHTYFQCGSPVCKSINILHHFVPSPSVSSLGQINCGLVLTLMIYSLRNKVVKVALKMFIQKIKKPEHQMPFLLIFTGIYVVTVAGNLGMITLIVLSSHLHNPMYYFLSSLSFIDFCQSTVVTPKMLVSFVRDKNPISYPGCMTQLYFFIIFGAAECHTLGVMAYDRYVAFCNPLLYNVSMSYQISSALISGVCIFSVLSASVLTGFATKIRFHESGVINHYFCDLPPLLKLSCSNTYINELLVLVFGTFNICVPFLTIITSYISIIVSILRIKSTEGRSKAFNTCSSHISAVAVFYGSAAFMYLQPSSVNSMNQGKVSSVFYTTVVPMQNPLIYSLRNKDVSVALKKILQRKYFMF